MQRRIKTFESFSHDFKRGKIEETLVKAGITLSSPDYTHLKLGSAPKDDLIDKALLEDIEKACRAAKVKALVTTIKSDHPVSDYSRHMKNLAVDIAMLGDESMDFNSLQGSNNASESNLGNPKFKEWGDRLAVALVALGYTLVTEKGSVHGEGGHDKAVIWQIDRPKMGNHYNHLHVSNTSGIASTAAIPAGSLAGTISPGSSQNLPSKIPTKNKIGGDLNDEGGLDNEFVEPPATAGSIFLKGLVKSTTGKDVEQADIRRAIEILKR
jgi:hypothetical protein